jgi:hypothetical protein
LAAAKAENDLNGMKQSLYLSKKAPILLDEMIANPTTINTTQRDTMITQFETFLQALQTKYGDLSATASQTQPQNTIFNSLTQE